MDNQDSEEELNFPSPTHSNTDPTDFTPIKLSKTRDDSGLFVGKRSFTQPVNNQALESPKLVTSAKNKNASKPQRSFGRRNTLGNLMSAQGTVSPHVQDLEEVIESSHLLQDLLPTDLKKMTEFSDISLENNNETISNFNKSQSTTINSGGQLNHHKDYPTNEDKIPSVNPMVNVQDTLWTQIDVLDDVKKMADEAVQSSSFFTEKYEADLSNLRKNQLSLLNSMKILEKQINSNEYSENTWFKFDINLEKSEDLKHLYNNEHFENVRECMNSVRENLGHVSETLRED